MGVPPPPPPEKQDFGDFWLHNVSQRGVFASVDGHIKTLQCPRNKKMSGRFCTRTSQRHMRLSKKYFLSKKGPRGHHFAGSGLGAKNSPKSWKISVPSPPPGTTKMSLVGPDFRGGGRERGCCGDETCENRGASRPICAQEEQLKPYGTVRRAIFARSCARTVAAAFP